MNNIQTIAKQHLLFGPFDALAIGVLDFKNNKFQAYEYELQNSIVVENKNPEIYFDLASLTKPLTNSLAYLIDPEAFTIDDKLCLNHRGGLPSWGLLPRLGWKEQIQNYQIKESETLYSDFSALRVYLNVSERSDVYQRTQKFWDKELMNWLKLNQKLRFVQTGYINQLPNFGKVHDPNAYVLNELCSHAGLFGTVSGVCRTLLRMDKELGLNSKMMDEMNLSSHRFVEGWDRVIDPQNTLAGKGCSQHTFGHLGFTGTSIWIDADKKLGHVILTNAVKEHWYEKKNLNDLRRSLGEEIWKLDAGFF